MKKSELKDFLDTKAYQYENKNFISSDPIQIPYRFSKKEDIEIASFLTAIIAWGNRKMIINNANKMMHLLDNAPYDFIQNHTEKDLTNFSGVIHRTFNANDFIFFIQSLKNIYQNHNGLEEAFFIKDHANNYQQAISDFKKVFFEIPHLNRTTKHISDPLKNSAAKRINMFLRWMVRANTKGVDFGIWKKHHPANLHCPLDIHSGNVARKLGLLTRKQNDWKALVELDTTLRNFDKNDPVKYDFSLFGLGVFEKF
ncbi:TIGR02757 family protein [Tenacibaculum sp. UWU-22]|uniref:TIGR02757 family protein n=1 Tax=Tenacibaculum sp. UWU-22 TaxID=3234187 RepID=UPI0034DB00C2